MSWNLGIFKSLSYVRATKLPMKLWTIKFFKNSSYFMKIFHKSSKFLYRLSEMFQFFVLILWSVRRKLTKVDKESLTYIWVQNLNQPVEFLVEICYSKRRKTQQ
jgi:hypothetical protein